jgi:hypothetical protein
MSLRLISSLGLIVDCTGPLLTAEPAFPSSSPSLASRRAACLLPLPRLDLCPGTDAQLARNTRFLTAEVRPHSSQLKKKTHINSPLTNNSKFKSITYSQLT